MLHSLCTKTFSVGSPAEDLQTRDKPRVKWLYLKGSGKLKINIVKSVSHGRYEQVSSLSTVNLFTNFAIIFFTSNSCKFHIHVCYSFRGMPHLSLVCNIANPLHMVIIGSVFVNSIYTEAASVAYIINTVTVYDVPLKVTSISGHINYTHHF